MKLSEAIRKGSKGTEQTFGSFFRFRQEGQMPTRLVGCCTFGAAWRGCFPDDVEASHVDYERLGEVTGTDLFQVVEVRNEPHFGEIHVALIEKIVGLNDDEHRSRDYIADWLEAQGM